MDFPLKTLLIVLTVLCVVSGLCGTAERASAQGDYVLQTIPSYFEFTLYPGDTIMGLSLIHI